MIDPIDQWHKNKAFEIRGHSITETCTVYVRRSEADQACQIFFGGKNRPPPPPHP